VKLSKKPTINIALMAVVLALGALTLIAGSATAAPLHGLSSTNSKAWSNVLAKARGESVSLWMWGGDLQANAYVDKVLAPEAAKFGVKLRRVPIADTKDAINRVLAEKRAGTHRGSVDLIWVNGDNFRTGVQAGLWRCGWADSLPNARALGVNDPVLTSDFGTPVNGCESPWHKAQFTLVYNAATVTNPPRTMKELFSWVIAHPGRFTYPAPPDFTGSAFIRQSLYSVSGGYRNVPNQYSADAFKKIGKPLWSELSALAPYLWRKGETYPQTSVALDNLYSQSQVDFTMTYGPATLTKLVADGTFPPSTKVLLLREGSLGNASFLGLPITSGASAGAEVVANLALSPQQQAAKADPKIWGQFTVLDMAHLSVADRSLFAHLPTSKVVPTFDVLSKNSNPELAASWVGRLDAGWRQSVLRAK
jgi:putative spermidine/putrescine transport system substrate-binding protein